MRVHSTLSSLIRMKLYVKSLLVQKCSPSFQRKPEGAFALEILVAAAQCKFTFCSWQFAVLLEQARKH